VNLFIKRDMKTPMEAKKAREHGYIGNGANLEVVLYNYRSNSLDFLEISMSKWISRHTLDLDL
jgi:hypothetical protein